MRVNRQIARAVAGILGTHIGLAAAADAPATSETASGLQEVVVTAQRRSENAQNVPIAIQAFSAQTLQELSVTNFDDLVKHLPNVSAASQGPGISQINMRGLSSGVPSFQSGGSINGFPNVAVYLDEQSGQLPGRNLDVYAADLERIEVLEGPQGTLFGAGAQAGVIRYITNKPKIDVTEGNVTAGYGTTAGGDNNSNLTAVLNVPLISDTLAVRGVVYNEQRGGYINNVPGTFTRKETDQGIHYANFPCPGNPAAFCPPPGSPVINNYNLAANAINPVTYKGLRVSALWKFNDAWDLLVAQTYQDMDAQGVFYQMPFSSDGEPLPKQSVTLFNNSFNKDRFSNTAWTVDGALGPLKMVYAGSYLVRNVETIQDYTNYARGFYADYYQCHGPTANGLPSTCYSPSTVWNETLRNTHLSQELRLSTPDDWRLRGILGGFWENLRIYDQLNWNYKTLPPCTSTVEFGCLTQVGPVPGSNVNNPEPIRNENTAFFNDVKRGYKQWALFTSWDFDIVPHVLTITAGTRYYHFENDESGAVVGSFGCYEAGPAPCLASATDIGGENLRTTEKGFKSRANVTWHVLPTALVYFTWSQGFRPGAFNRSAACYVPGPQGINLYCSPLAYKSDNLTNNELGWKSELFDRRLQWNGAIYQEDWTNAQVSFFDPGELGNVGFNTNGPNFRIRGIETSIVALLTQSLTFEGAASWNSSNQTNSPYLIANNPELLNNPATAGEYGKPILSITNPYGPPGSPSANSPPFQFSARLRYQWALGSYNMFAQVGATHTAHSFTQSGQQNGLPPDGVITTTLIRFENPAYTQYDASINIARDAWWAQVYGQNLTNVVTSTFTSTSQFALQQVITRPRVLGLEFGYRF